MLPTTPKVITLKSQHSQSSYRYLGLWGAKRKNGDTLGNSHVHSHHRRSKSASDKNASVSRGGVLHSIKREQNETFVLPHSACASRGQSPYHDNANCIKKNTSSNQRASLEKDIELLQFRLQQEKSMRIMLERAMGRASSTLSPGHRHFTVQTKELISEIELLEEEVANREQHVLSLYRNIFDNCVSRPPSEQNSVKTSPAHTKHGSRKHPSIISSAFCSSKKFPLHPLQALVSLDDPWKRFSKSSHPPPSSGKSKNMDFEKTWFDPAQVREKVPALPKAAVLRTLKDHLYQCPSKLSEEMVRCMAAIYCWLSQEASVNNEKNRSPLSSRSSRNVIQPRCTIGENRDWSCKPMIEISWISNDKSHFSHASYAINNYRVLVEQLERVNASQMENNAQIAFWINVYNALLMHAYLAYGIPQSSLRRLALFHKAAYNIGGHVISANAIEHSIFCFRAPRMGRWLETILSTALRKKYGEERQLSSKVGLQSSQPLACFSLCTGSFSDPVLKLYTASNVKEELEVAKREFLQANVVVKKSRKVFLPKVLERYAREASLSSDDLLTWITEHVDKKLRDSIHKCIDHKSGKKASQIIEWLPYSSRFRLVHNLRRQLGLALLGFLGVPLVESVKRLTVEFFFFWFGAVDDRTIGDQLRDQTGRISSPDGGRDIPMDYDDNEFQSQNLHLTGEGSTKFPPVLLPYALPKFDFDDSLQGHLRFDSLVETEVFLGIESNEDNQWIEDFSRGSSGIEFNPSATESCTIARRNNVWSEATSSESVEMLLKSVGQEEVILRQTIVKESDACDELGCLAKQMEPNPVHDNNISRTVDVTNLQSTLLQNEIPENSSGLKGDVPEEQPHVEDTSLSHEVALSVGGTSGELDTNSINRSDVDTLAEEYLSDKTRKDSSDSAMQVGSIVVYTEDIIARGSEVNNEDLLHQFDDLSSMNSNGVETGNDGIEEEFNLLSREAEIADQNLNRDIVESSTSHSESHLGLTSKLEYVEEGNATGNRTSNVAEPSSMVDNSDSDLHVAERCLEDVGIRIPDEARKHDLVLVKDTDVCDPSKVNTQEVSPLTIKDDTNHEGYAVQVRNFKVLLTHGQESPGEKNDLLESGCKLDNEMLASKSEALLLSMENREVSNVEGDPNNNSHEGGTSSVALVCSSPQLLKETHETESLKEIHNGFGVSREDLITEDHVLSSTGNESSQTCGEEKIQGKSGVPEGDIDVSVSANESTELPSNFSSVVGGSLIIDKGVGSSFFCEESTGNEPIMSKLQFDANVGNESASNAILENAKVASSDTMSGVLLPSDNGVTTDGVIDCREVQMTASVVGYTHSDKKEPPATKISTDESISILMESSEVENELGPVSETEKDASGKVSQETVDGSLPMAESCNAESQSEAQMAVTGGVNQECPRRMEVHAVSSDIATEVGDFENTPSKVSGDVYKVHEGSLSSALLPESQNDLCALESVSASANVDKHTCSPNITRATEQSQRENENEQEKASKEEGINGPTDQNAPVSEVIDVDASNILPISGDPKRNETFEQEQNFTFEISSLADLSRKDTAKNSQPFPFMHAGKVTPIVEGSPSTTGLVPMEAKISREISHGSPQVSEGQITRGGKSSGERKTRRRSGKATGKETAKKGNHAKETTPARQSERGDKSTNVSVSPSAIFQFVQSSEMQHYGHVEGSNTKPIFVLTASTSNLPDLNTSASPSTMFQQPFTDLQQVQLRAQIFVYGALIQGTVPEEAHMISAFGGPDGGKSIWENAWRASAERLHIHKSQPITPETPLQLRPGVRALEQAIKQNVFQSKGISSPLGRTSSKGIPTVVNSVVALSSPLWSIPTPCDALQSSVMPRGSVMDYQQALSPLHPYQTSPVRNFVGHNTSWIPQVPFRGPWMASPQTSAPDATTHISGLPNAEIIKSTPIRESSMPHTSAIKHVSASPMVQSGVPTSAPLLDPKEVKASPRQNSTDPKSRRRKKTPVSSDPGQFVLQSQSQPKPVSAPAVISHPSTSVSVTTPTGFASKTTSEKFIISEPPLSSTDILKRAGQDVERRAALSEETLRKVKEARLQAEDAAALSADAVSHSHKIWSQMEKQKHSGLVPDVEAKLTSAAVAIAAAAAVAKAAAAAANVASNAALQAQLMAEEALFSNVNDDPSQCNGASLPDSVDILGKATPASILTGENGTNSSGSIITVAKEAVRKRADSASAAAKRAENMDAIVKAAELAAEAISQAGKIVAMGDSLPLSELVEAGPGGYWKGSRDSSELVLKASNMNREELNRDSVRGGPDTSTKHSKEGRLDKKVAQSTTLEKSPITTEMPKGSMEDHMRLADGISGIVMANEKDSRGQKGRRALDLAKTIGVVPESEIGSRPSITIQNEYEKAAENFKLSCIKEGSLVEVLKSTDGFKAAWFTANVLNLDDGKAYVSYTELQTDNGEGQLKEYVALQGEGDKPPRIRPARTVTALQYEGTRKRRRAAMGDYNWSVGDRVDALIEDSWREGVVTEKNKKDETALNVHFPVHGETSVVRAWHLRPSLIWKDGEWVEWSNLRENVRTSLEDDTPKEKRVKLGGPVTEAKGKDKVFKSRSVVESGKLEESRLLDLSATDKIFNIGKNSRNENKPDALRTLRSGLQKERSKVIFGVPKPGKKRKFMEVSKHYVVDQSNKITEANDSVKFQKYTMPRGSGSRGWKNSSKNDLKEKQRAETKPRALKSGKAQSLSERIIPAKDNLLNAVSAPDDATLADLSAKDKDSTSNAENTSGKNNKLEIGSLSSVEGTTEGPLLFSSLAPSSDGSSKKVSTSNAKSVRANKGKIAPAGGKLARIEEEKVFNGNPAKSASEVVEPRRSNRRIQPTSRLLEGLQSSLTISKIPSVSHDKGHKSLIRTASRGSNQG